MGQLSNNSIFKAIMGLFSSLDSTDETLLRNTMWRFNAVGYFTDGGTAGTAQTETAFWTNDTGVAMKVTSVKIVTPVAVATNGTNFGTATVSYRTSAGGGATAIGAQSTAATSLTAFAPTSVSITAGNDIVPVGGVLTIALSKAASGVAFAAATSQAYVSVQLEPAL